MESILTHPETIGALTGVGTLIVWMIYLHVFVSSYRRQIRATLLISRGEGHGLEGRCLACNMSSGPIYLESVLVSLERPSGTTMRPVTEPKVETSDLPARAGRRTRQGPLQSGETVDLGSFSDLVREAVDEGPSVQIPADLTSLVVEIIANYGSEDLPVGARRRFDLRREHGSVRVIGRSIRTEQLRGRRRRRELLRDLSRDR